MASEEEIKRKFDKLFTEALQSPLPKLKYRGPVKKHLALTAVNNNGDNTTISSKIINHFGSRRQHLSNKLSAQQTSTNKLSGQQSSSNKLSGEQSSSIKLSGQQSSSNKLSGQQSSSNKLSGQQSSSNKLSGQQSSSNKLSGQQSSSNKLSGQQRSTKKLSGQQRSTKKLSGQQSSTNKLSGQQSSTNKLSGQQSSSNKLSGQQRSTNKLSGQQSSSNKLYGQQSSSSKLSRRQSSSSKLSGQQCSTNKLSGHLNSSNKFELKSDALLSETAQGDPKLSNKSCKDDQLLAAASSSSRRDGNDGDRDNVPLLVRSDRQPLVDGNKQEGCHQQIDAFPSLQQNDKDTDMISDTTDIIKAGGVEVNEESDSDDDLPCSGHVSQPHTEDDNDNDHIESSVSDLQQGGDKAEVVDKDGKVVNIPINGNVKDQGSISMESGLTGDCQQKQDTKDKRRHAATIPKEPIRTERRSVGERKVPEQRKQPRQKAKRHLLTKTKKSKRLKKSESEIVSRQRQPDTDAQEEGCGLISDGPRQDVEHKDDDDDDGVSSLIGEDEEFFLHKPKPYRDATKSTKCRRLNVDGLWSRILIQRSPGEEAMECQSMESRRFLQRNLTKGERSFRKYISQMRAHQKDLELCPCKIPAIGNEANTKSDDGKTIENNQSLNTRRRGQKRKSVGDAMQTSSCPAGIVKKSRQKIETKATKSSKLKQCKEVLSEGGDKVHPQVRRLSNSKSTVKRIPKAQKREKPISVKTSKKRNSNRNKKGCISDISGDEEVLLFDSEEPPHNKQKSKTKPVNRTKQQRRSVGDTRTGRSSTEWKVSAMSSGSSAAGRDAGDCSGSRRQVGRATRVVRSNGMPATDVTSKVMPLSSHCQSAGSAGEVMGNTPAASAAVSDLAIGDPLVAGALREDWGLGIRSLFGGTVGGKTHCGGIWKAIVDEHS